MLCICIVPQFLYICPRKFIFFIYFFWCIYLLNRRQLLRLRAHAGSVQRRPPPTRPNGSVDIRLSNGQYGPAPLRDGQPVWQRHVRHPFRSGARVRPSRTRRNVHTGAHLSVLHGQADHAGLSTQVSKK